MDEATFRLTSWLAPTVTLNFTYNTQDKSA